MRPTQAPAPNQHPTTPRPATTTTTGTTSSTTSRAAAAVYIGIGTGLPVSLTRRALPPFNLVRFTAITAAATTTTTPTKPNMAGDDTRDLPLRGATGSGASDAESFEYV